MKLYIISEHSEEENIEALRPHFKESGINLTVLYPGSDFMSKAAALKMPQAILWISSKTSSALFDIATERNNRGLTTINYFADEVGLSESQKNAVGRNRSVFAELNPKNNINDLVSIINEKNKYQLNQETIILPSQQSKSEEIKDKGMATSEVSTFQSTSYTTEKNEDNNETTSSEEENPETKENKGGVMKPWKALITIIVTYVVEYCIEDAHQFYNDEIFPYIMFAVCTLICAGCTGSVMNWRDKNGKSLFSGLVILIGSLMALFYAWLFVKNLWNFIF